MSDHPWHKDTDTAMGVNHPYAEIENLGTTHKGDATPTPATPQTPLQKALTESL